MEFKVRPGEAIIYDRYIGEDDVSSALRLLNLELAHKGITPEQVREWSTTTCFPNLRGAPEILNIQARLDELLKPEAGELWAEPQLLMKFPSEFEGTAPFHVDTPPPWAPDRPYSAIVGVALTEAKLDDGCLVVDSYFGPFHVPVLPGSVIVMHPDLPHRSGVNRRGTIRYTIYYRLLSAV